MIRKDQVHESGIDVFEPPRDDRFGIELESDFKTFLIRRHVQCTTIPHDLLADFSRLAAARRKEIANGIWADAARVPRSSRHDTIYGALLRQAGGHPVYGDDKYDDKYYELEELLAAELAEGYRVVRLDGRLSFDPAFGGVQRGLPPSSAKPVGGAA